MILIWSKEENEQVWDSERCTVGTVCDGYRMGDAGRRTGVPSSLHQQHRKPHLLDLAHVTLIYSIEELYHSIQSHFLWTTQGACMHVCVL